MKRDNCGVIGLPADSLLRKIFRLPQPEPVASAHSVVDQLDRKAFLMPGGWVMRLAVLSLTVAVLVFALTSGRGVAEATVVTSSARATETPKPMQQSTVDLQQIQRMLKIERDAVRWAVQQNRLTEQSQQIQRMLKIQQDAVRWAVQQNRLIDQSQQIQRAPQQHVVPVYNPPPVHISPPVYNPPSYHQPAYNPLPNPNQPPVYNPPSYHQPAYSPPMLP